MGLAEQRTRDAATASYMKAHPGQFPDSMMRPHKGVGSDVRELAKGSRPAQSGSHFNRGMFGGVLLARLGLGSFGIPKELLA